MTHVPYLNQIIDHNIAKMKDSKILPFNTLQIRKGIFTIYIVNIHTRKISNSMRFDLSSASSLNHPPTMLNFQEKPT